MPKFSEVVATDKATSDDVLTATQVLTTATTTHTIAHTAVVTALKAANKPVGLIQADSSIVVYTVAPSGDDFTTEVIAGDFEVPA